MQKYSHIFCLLLSLVCCKIINDPFICLAESSGKHSQNRMNTGISSELKVKFDQQLTKLISSKDAAVLVSPQGEILLSRNSQIILIPASTFKILTALVAIRNLGSEFRFKTDFYLDKDRNLKIRGYGDPLLISEDLNQIAQQLSRQISSVQDIVIDDGFFQTEIKIPGKNKSLQPYDAPNGALCVNFNTVAFKKVDDTYVSAEKQTPLLPFALAKAKSSGLKKGRIMLSGGHAESIRYAGELIRYFLIRAGIEISGKIRRGNIDPLNDKLKLHYLSRFTLEQVITRLMEFSNNFIANQVFLTTGAEVLGEPATLAKGVQVAETYTQQYLNLKDVTIVEGSGLSRQNRISAAAMIILLQKFEPYFQLLRHGKKEYYKTGTLSDVKTRAGFLEDDDGRRYPFVVLINTPKKTTNAVMQLFRQTVAAAKM